MLTIRISKDCKEVQVDGSLVKECESTLGALTKFFTLLYEILDNEELRELISGPNGNASSQESRNPFDRPPG